MGTVFRKKTVKSFHGHSQIINKNLTIRHDREMTLQSALTGYTGIPYNHPTLWLKIIKRSSYKGHPPIFNN